MIINPEMKNSVIIYSLSKLFFIDLFLQNCVSIVICMSL